MELIHHGHACIELRHEGTTLLFDPGNFSDFDAVTGADAIVITHQHPDHLDFDRLDTLRRNHPSASWFADPQTCAKLAEQGVTATSTGAGEEYVVGGFTLTGVGQTHAEIHPYIDRINNVGMLVTAPGEPTLFHPGDSLEGRPRDVDYLCVPVTAPWQAVKETIEFVRALAPRHVIPIHDKTASEAGRGIYLQHITNFGMDGGVDVIDIPVGESRQLR